MVNGFTKKRVGTMTLGEKLRKFREDRRINLNEVSRVTRIQVKYLEALETGNYRALPADVYVKGFLRSYGDFFGIDESALVKLYEKEKGIKENLEKSKNPNKYKESIKPVNISSFVFTPKKLAIAGVSVLIFLALVYLYREVGSFADAPRLAVLSPQDNFEVDGNSTIVEGFTDKDARLFINEQPILVNDEGRFREELTLQSGVNKINVRAKNKFDKEVTETITVQAKYEDKTDQNSDSNEDPNTRNSFSGEEVSQGSSNTQDLQLELKVDPGPVWISVESDGELVYSGTMLAGAVQSFKAKEKFVINSGRANATYLKFNGKDVGVLGQDQGAVRGVTFDKNTKY